MGAKPVSISGDSANNTKIVCTADEAGGSIVSSELP
jgi:hypothetical protein